MVDNKSEKKKDDSEVIQIPVGKFIGSVRNNPWMIVSIVLAIALVIALFNSGFSGKSSSEVGQSVIDFVNAQGSGVATLQDISKQDNLYKVEVLYQGQVIPVYVTMDGKYLITNLIDLTEQLVDNQGAGAGEKVQVEVGDAPILGDKNAPVTIVEFSDYQCPFCRKFWTDTYPQLKKDYIDTGKVKLAFKDYPLDFHAAAIPAAEAARCAREKGGDAAYWKMHDKMFSEQNILDGGTVKSTVQFTSVELKKWAKEIGYNIDSCLDSGKYKDDITADMAYGQSIGVTGTPGFFVNGISIEGAVPYDVFKQIIDSELQ